MKGLVTPEVSIDTKSTVPKPCSCGGICFAGFEAWFESKPVN